VLCLKRRGVKQGCAFWSYKKYKSSAIAENEMGDRGHNRHGPRRREAAVPLSRGELGPRLTQCGRGRGLLPYQVASSSILSLLATIDMGRNLGAVPPLGGAGTQSNTTSPGPRFTSVPSGILIHPTVRPQRTWAENWGLCPFRTEGSGSPSNTMSLIG